MAGHCKYYANNTCMREANLRRYVGATDGIHEFSVNVAGRKTFPSLVLR